MAAPTMVTMMRSGADRLAPSGAQPPGSSGLRARPCPDHLEEAIMVRHVGVHRGVPEVFQVTARQRPLGG